MNVIEKSKTTPPPGRQDFSSTNYEPMKDELIEMIYEQLCLQVSKEFEIITTCLGDKLCDFEDEHKEIQLTFSREDTNVLASAHFYSGEINFNLENFFRTSNSRTLIHELAHHVAYYYLNIKNHCLEFAIISYCILRKVNKNTDIFFNSYDIHEDFAYENLSFSPKKFNQLIRTINFDNFYELAYFAEIFSTAIRSEGFLN